VGLGERRGGRRRGAVSAAEGGEQRGEDEETRHRIAFEQGEQALERRGARAGFARSPAPPATRFLPTATRRADGYTSSRRLHVEPTAIRRADGYTSSRRLYVERIHLVGVVHDEVE